MFFNQTFKIFFDNGNVIETNNLLAEVSKMGADRFYYRMKWICNYEKQNFLSSYSFFKEWDFYYQNFYLYTSNNVMISPELFRSEYKVLIRNSYNTKKSRRQYSKKHTTTYDRKMKTIQQRRDAVAVLKEEGEPEFRGKRRKLPDPWDEYVQRRSLSWKNCTKRKRQYKGS